MQTFLGKYRQPIYAAMRAVLGFLYLSHAMQKLFGVFQGHQVQMGSKLGAAGVIEIGCGVLLIIGLFTAWAAFIASDEMAFAYFIAHAPKGGVPVLNGGEMAVALCFAFLYIATRGGDRWSLDG